MSIVCCCTLSALAATGAHAQSKSGPLQPPQLLSLLHVRGSLREAQQIHAHMFKTSQITDRYSAARMAEFYAITDDGSQLHRAVKVLDTFQGEPSTFMYNTVMRGHLLRQEPQRCLLLYRQMLLYSVETDNFTFTFALKASTRVRSLATGKQVHTRAVKRRLACNRHIRNKLIHLYAVCGEMGDAGKVFDGGADGDVVAWNSMLGGYAENGDGESLHRVFDEMPAKDVVSWNTMMAFYVETCRYEEAMSVFRRMQEKGEELNRVTLITALSAIAQMGALGQGRWLHACLRRKGAELDDKTWSALINMYSKCGCLEGAVQAFEESKHEIIDTWNAMICGFTGNGESGKALELFRRKEEEFPEVRPNAITYACVLNACSHGGFVGEGVEHFAGMKSVHGIEPDITHYGCMVDLFCRAGMFDRAEAVIAGMPMDPDPVMWKAVAGACRVHGNLEMGERAGLELVELAPDDHAGYVLLSNLYAAAKEWGGVHGTRRRMRERGVKKVPGCSSVESGGAVHEFVAGDVGHPRRKEVYQMLDEMGERLRLAGYEPDTTQVLLDIEDEGAREVSLSHHSERLAVAYGLISTTPGTVIRVVKNLRVCGDCHTAIKLLSHIYDRHIILRDSNRFHHFRHGSCSCMDYW